MTQQEDPAAAALKLFQSANGKLITLQRINDQLSGLLSQRQRVQEELRVIKAQIDQVFEQQLRQEAPTPRTPQEMSAEAINMRLSAMEPVTPTELPPLRRPTLERVEG